MHPAPECECELEQAEFFRALSRDALRRLYSLVHTKSFAPRSVLFFQGEPAESLWVVRAGEVRLYKNSADGTTTTLETLVSGEIFGALSALDEETYPASAEAITAGVASCLPRKVLLRHLHEDPSLATEILTIVAGRLREAHERVRSLAHDPAPARLAGALVAVAKLGEAHVTRRALAETAGTTVETAIRVLRHFEREGVVRSEVGLVHVLDEPRLLRIARGELPGR